MAQGFSVRGAALGGLALIVVGACTSEIEVKDRVNPERGATQPEVDLGGGAATVSESEACDMLLSAFQQAESDLGCDSDRESDLVCPQFLRASAPGCSEYARNTVEECVEAIADYDRCEDLRDRPCIVSALSEDGCGGGGVDGSVGVEDGGASDAAVP